MDDPLKPLDFDESYRNIMLERVRHYGLCRPEHNIERRNTSIDL